MMGDFIPGCSIGTVYCPPRRQPSHVEHLPVSPLRLQTPTTRYLSTLPYLGTWLVLYRRWCAAANRGAGAGELHHQDHPLPLLRPWDVKLISLISRSLQQALALDFVSFFSAPPACSESDDSVLQIANSSPTRPEVTCRRPCVVGILESRPLQRGDCEHWATNDSPGTWHGSCGS